MDDMLQKAQERLGLTPDGSFITQGSTSDLLLDKKWIQARGVASPSKKDKMKTRVE
jgi:hypothetical protein